jgi:hypothetical protein
MKYALIAAIVGIAAVPGAAKPHQTGNAQHGELILYENPDFTGDYYIIDEPRLTVRTDWNIRSIAIHDGDKWQVCAKPRLQEPCITLGQSLPDASVVGIRGQIGSAKLMAGTELGQP